MSTSTYSKYEMLYCDYVRCRVNTFERGKNSRCPACVRRGLPVRAEERS